MTVNNQAIGARPGPALRNFLRRPRSPVLYDGLEEILNPFCLGGTAVNPWGGNATDSNSGLGGSATDTNLFGGSQNSGCLSVMQAVNITVGEFNDEVINLAITNNGNPFNLGGYGIQALFKTAAGVSDTDPSTLTLTSGGGAIVITNSAGGLATLTVPNADLQNTNFTFWRVDVTLGSQQFTAMYGTVTVKQL